MQQQRRRSGFIIGLLSLGLLAGAALTARPAQAVDAAGPYYAEPAWDRKIAAAGRFVVLTNWASQAVLDKETGLVWERGPVGTVQDWNSARFDCTARTTGDRKGWRLPSVHELTSLVDPSVPPPGPTLQPGHPFLNVQSAVIYWSATTYAEDTAKAWGVSFDVGSPGNVSKAGDLQVWCVRGGNSADQY